MAKTLSTYQQKTLRALGRAGLTTAKNKHYFGRLKQLCRPLVSLRLPTLKALKERGYLDVLFVPVLGHCVRFTEKGMKWFEEDAPSQ